MYLNVLNINSEYKSNTVEYNASCQLSPTSSPRPPPSMRGGEADEQIHSKYTSNTNRIQRDSLILCSRPEGAGASLLPTKHLLGLRLLLPLLPTKQLLVLRNRIAY